MHRYMFPLIYISVLFTYVLTLMCITNVIPKAFYPTWSEILFTFLYLLFSAEIQF